MMLSRRSFGLLAFLAPILPAALRAPLFEVKSLGFNVDAVSVRYAGWAPVTITSHDIIANGIDWCAIPDDQRTWRQGATQ